MNTGLKKNIGSIHRCVVQLIEILRLQCLLDLGVLQKMSLVTHSLTYLLTYKQTTVVVVIA